MINFLQTEKEILKFPIYHFYRITKLNQNLIGRNQIFIIKIYCSILLNENYFSIYDLFSIIFSNSFLLV